MYPFERFNELAKKALSLAQEEAQGLQCSYIGTEHLLLGLLRDREGLAAKVLDNLGVEISEVRPKIESILARNQQIVIQQIIPTSRVKKVVEISFEEARRMGSSYVGTEHLLLGLLVEGEGIAAHVLKDLGAGLNEVRTEIDRLLEGDARERATQTPPTTESASALRLATELQQLLRRARTLAAQRQAPAIGLEPLLEAMVGTDAGMEVLARLLDLRQTRDRSKEQEQREAFEQALAAWRAELYE